MKSALHWKLPDEYDHERIAGFLEDRYCFRVETSLRQKRLYLDTFDWLLFGKSLVLYRSGDELVLQDLFRSTPGTRVDVDATPVFASDIVAGSMRDRLSSAIKARALLELVDVTVDTTIYRVLNQDEKTVARLAFIQTGFPEAGSRSDQRSYLSLLPVRGYPKYAKKLARDLGPGEQIQSIDEAILCDALRATGQRAGSYTSKLDLKLDAEMRSDDATRVILRRLLETMRANEAGIRADTDIEFLHDYRVAIRKTRSALSQISGVFAADETERYRRDFRSLGQSTNALRDLDVYLQSEDKYRAMLSGTLKDDIKPLFEYLRSQRAQAHALVIETIDSTQTEKLLRDWEVFLSQHGGDTTAPNAGVPALRISRQRIYRRYRRIVKRGRKLVKAAKDEELHDLRIECKKLRYLLEFFASLYPPKKMAGLIRELKKLQENLGDFNDLSVQGVYLLENAENLLQKDPTSAKALLATGALVEVLARRQKKVKGEFAEIFSEFASKKNRRVYNELFSVK